MRRIAMVVAALVLGAGTVTAQEEPRPASPTLAGRVAQGDSAWAREDHPAALAAYSAVLREDSTYSSRAVFRTGLLNAWRNRFGPALAALRLYTRLEPSDAEGRIALARTYAWASRFPEALANYDTVLARDADYREAVIGRATTLAWADRIPEAERAIVAWLDEHPQDSDAWVQVAQFRRWRGAPHAAEAALLRAQAIAPDSPEARLQLQWVRADIRPSASAVVVLAEDSEANVMSYQEVSGAFVTRSNLRFTGALRQRQVRLGSSATTRIPGAHAQVQWQPGGGAWIVRGEAGVVDYPAGGVSGGSLQGRAALRASGRVGQKLSVGGGVGREPFDEVLTMADRELMFTVADVDLAYAVSPRLTASLAASRGEVGGVGITDGRTTALGAVRWVPRRGTTIALTHREVSWDEPAFGIFFAPQRWMISEASVGWERTAELGLVLGGDLAVGSQGVGFGSAPLDRSTAPRAVMRLGWRPQPGREIVGSIVYANVAGAGTLTASDYRYGALTLTGRWTF
jgi:tetratricopeptide (TPR) repeat protein